MIKIVFCSFGTTYYSKNIEVYRVNFFLIKKGSFHIVAWSES